MIEQKEQTFSGVRINLNVSIEGANNISIPYEKIIRIN